MKRPVSVRSRRDLLKATYERYQKAEWSEKKAILDEFTAATGYHRKYAMDVLNHPPRHKPRATKHERRHRYGIVVRQALVVADIQGVWQSHPAGSA